MKVKINIDAIEPTINTLVESYLGQSGLPSCYGSMIPPVLLKWVEFDDAEILAIRKSVQPEDIFDEVIEKYIDPKSAKMYEDKVLTKIGKEKIVKYKEDRAKLHVGQIQNCSVCKISDTCYKLTKNYLQFLSIEEK